MKTLKGIICSFVFLCSFVVFGIYARKNISDDFWKFYSQFHTTESIEIFAKDQISAGIHEHHLVISPDFKEMFFSIADRYRVKHFIIQVVYQNGIWSKPEIASFSGKYSDFAPTYSHNGDMLFFCSDRPTHPQDKNPDFNIWRLRKSKNKWIDPEPLPFPVNDDSNEYNPTLAESGNIYFQDHDKTGVDIYFSQIKNGKYSVPKKLSYPVNTKFGEIGPLIFDDEAALIFSSDRPGGEGYFDYYLSRKQIDGSWSKPKNLGKLINSKMSDAIITISPDQNYFFFTRFRIPEYQKLDLKTYDQIKSLFQLPEFGDGTLYWAPKSLFINDMSVNK